MKTLLPLLFALLLLGCASAPSQKTVTLHDVDPNLAASEGADQRYQMASKPNCSG